MQVEDSVIEMVVYVAKKFRSVKRIFLFGSRAKQTQSKVSDFDLAFEWVEQIPPKIPMESWGEFAEQLREKNPSLFQLDLVRLDRADTELKVRIQTEGKLIYEQN